MENLKNSIIGKNSPIFTKENSNPNLKNNEITKIYNPTQFFEVIYSLKKLGTITYYIVDLNETLDNNLKSRRLINEEENISKRNSKKFINTNKKIESKSTIKRKKGQDINNKGELHSSFKLKNKPKVSFDESQSKINVLNNMDKTYEQASNNSKNNNEDNNIIIKKQSNNIDNSNIDEKNDKLISKKKTKFFDNTEYLKRKKSKKNDILDEDENSPLITKDQFKEGIKRLNKKNQIIIIIIFSLILILLFLILILIYFSFSGYSDTEKILYALTYIEKIKVDIYMEAILSIIYCVYENDEILNLEETQRFAKNQLQDILVHLKILQDQIDTILNNKNSIKIFEIIEERFSIIYLENDWQINMRKVDILEEIRRFSYNIYSLTSSNNICNINLFYRYFQNSDEFYENKYISNDLQKIFFYFGANIFTNYKTTFDRLSEEFINSLENLWIQFKSILLLLLLFIIIISVSFLVFYIIKVCHDYSYFQLLFLYYFNIENEQLEFQNKIYYLYKTITDFKYYNIKYFENIKMNYKNIDNNLDIKNSLPKIIEINDINNDIKNNINQKDFLKRKSFTNINRNDNKIILEKNSMNGSILNDSINGSSLQFLNNSNNKMPLNNNIENNDLSFISNINKNEKNIYSKEESIDTILKISNKIIPNSLKISFIIILILLLISFLIASIEVYEISSEDKVWNFTINLSMNILERIPSLMGIIIYASLSIIIRDFNILDSYLLAKQQNYMTYFKADTLYYSEDIINKYFSKSYFGVYLKNNLRISYNLDNYLMKNKNLKNILKWETLLNTKGNFCLYSSLGDLSIYTEESTLYNLMKVLNIKSSNCKKLNSGINESGANLQISYILQEITNKYIEFITYNGSDINFEKLRDRFFQSKEIKNVFLDIEYSAVMYFNTFLNAVNLDIDNLNKSIASTQRILSLTLICINLIIIIFLINAIVKDENNKKLFGFFSEIPNNNNEYN